MHSWVPAIRIDRAAAEGAQRHVADAMAKPATREELDRRVRDYLPRALRLAVRLCDDDELAEEAVQEALVRVARSWRRFRGLSTFETWMGRIVIRCVRDGIRRRRTTASLDDVDPPAGPEFDDPESRALAAERGECVRRAVARLPDRQREVLVLVTWEGCTTDEVARLLKINNQNVHATLHAARKRLRQLLDNAGGV